MGVAAMIGQVLSRNIEGKAREAFNAQNPDCVLAAVLGVCSSTRCHSVHLLMFAGLYFQDRLHSFLIPAMGFLVNDPVENNEMPTLLQFECLDLASPEHWPKHQHLIQKRMPLLQGTAVTREPQYWKKLDSLSPPLRESCVLDPYLRVPPNSERLLSFINKMCV